MPTKEVVQPKKMKKKWKWLLIILIVAILVALFSYFFVRIKRIDAGYIGVKSSLSNPVDNTSDLNVVIVKGGYIVYMPMTTDVTTYPTTVQTATYDAMNFASSDGVEFVVKPRISYQLDDSKANLFYKNHKGNFDQLNKNYLKEITAGAYTSAAIGFDSDSLIHNMGIFEDNVSKELTTRLAEMGLVLMNANANIEVPQKIKQLVEERNLSKHNTLLAQDKYQQEYLEANTQRVKDSLLNSSLTSLAIQKMFIDKWDGRLIAAPIEMPQVFKDTTQIK